MRTKTVARRSSRERGRKAERIPTGIAISSHMIAPPATTESVTGRTLTRTEFTSRSLTHDGPRHPRQDEPNHASAQGRSRAPRASRPFEVVPTAQLDGLALEQESDALAGLATADLGETTGVLDRRE